MVLAGLAHITKGMFDNSYILLPPFNEQDRIVSKLDELFTKLDAGVEELKKLKIHVKHYRQSVLKFAFEGKLTEKWRTKNKNKIEPTAKLLIKINEERKKTLGNKYKEPELLNDNDLPLTPKGWMWVLLDALIKEIQYGTSEKASKSGEGIPVIRMGNIQDSKLVYNSMKYFPLSYAQKSKYLLEDGDVLFNRTNSAELVGKSAVYKSSLPVSVFASYLIRIKLYQDSYKPDFLNYFINSEIGKNYIKSVVSQQVGQANVNGSKLKNMPVPLLSTIEQQQIVSEIERHFSIADEAEKIIEQSLNQAERIRQSILKKAFEGKLVPQDPNDEPTEKLLERIKKNQINIINKK